MMKYLAIGIIGLCIVVSSASPSASQQSGPNKVDWSSKSIGTRVIGKVVDTNDKNHGAYIKPDTDSYLLFVTFANVSGAEDMPKQGDWVEIEYVPVEVGDKLATVTGGSGNKTYYGHKVYILRKKK